MNEVKLWIFIKYCSFAFTRKIWELWILYSYHTVYTSWRSHRTGSHYHRRNSRRTTEDHTHTNTLNMLLLQWRMPSQTFILIYRMLIQNWDSMHTVRTYLAIILSAYTLYCNNFRMMWNTGGLQCCNQKLQFAKFMIQQRNLVFPFSHSYHTLSCHAYTGC